MHQPARHLRRDPLAGMLGGGVEDRRALPSLDLAGVLGHLDREDVLAVDRPADPHELGDSPCSPLRSRRARLVMPPGPLYGRNASQPCTACLRSTSDAATPSTLLTLRFTPAARSFDAWLVLSTASTRAVPVAAVAAGEFVTSTPSSRSFAIPAASTFAVYTSKPTSPGWLATRALEGVTVRVPPARAATASTTMERRRRSLNIAYHVPSGGLAPGPRRRSTGACCAASRLSRHCQLDGAAQVGRPVRRGRRRLGSSGRALAPRSTPQTGSTDGDGGSAS